MCRTAHFNSGISYCGEDDTGDRPSLAPLWTGETAAGEETKTDSAPPPAARTGIVQEPEARDLSLKLTALGPTPIARYC